VRDHLAAYVATSSGDCSADAINKFMTQQLDPKLGVALKICHDIATTNKHVEIRKQRAAREHLRSGNIILGPHGAPLGTRDPTPREPYRKFEIDVISSDGTRTRALDVADRAICEWRGIAKGFGVDLPEDSSSSGR
jgi:hypothetical protein